LERALLLWCATHVEYLGGENPLWGLVLREGSFLFEDVYVKHLYVCVRYPECDSYVAAHDSSKKPMGSLTQLNKKQMKILQNTRIAKMVNPLFYWNFLLFSSLYKWRLFPSATAFKRVQNRGTLFLLENFLEKSIANFDRNV